MIKCKCWRLHCRPVISLRCMQTVEIEISMLAYHGVENTVHICRQRWINGCGTSSSDNTFIVCTILWDNAGLQSPTSQGLHLRWHPWLCLQPFCIVPGPLAVQAHDLVVFLAVKSDIPCAFSSPFHVSLLLEPLFSRRLISPAGFIGKFLLN